MRVLWIVALVLLVLLLLFLFLRLGGRVEYSSVGLRAWVCVGPIHVLVYPRKPKKKKKKKRRAKPAKEEKKPTKPKKKRRGGLLQTAQKLAPDLLELMGEAVRKLRVDQAILEYTIPGRYDPAGAAIQYGTIYATGGALYGILSQHLDLKECSIGAEVDFDETVPMVYVCLELSFRVVHLAQLGIHAAQAYLRMKKQGQKK